MNRAKICLTLCVLAFAVNLSAATRFRAASPTDPVMGRYEIVFNDTVLDAEAAATELARTYAARIEPFAGDGVAGAVMTMLPERARLMSNDPRVAMVTEIGVLAPPRPGVAESMARPTAPRPHAADAWSSGDYAYDAAGNIKSIGSDTYAYDSALRVVAATTENQRSVVARSQEYAYDSFGNRLHSTTTHNDLSRCVNGTLCEENVGIDKKTNRINTNGAEYDAAGNLTRIDAAYSYAYDAVGMLFRQQTPGVTQFVYTAMDERIAVYTAGRWEWSLRDHAGKVLRTFTSNDGSNEYGTKDFQWTKDYVFRGSLLLASDAPSGRRHYHLDHLGTPRVITDDGGRKLGTHAYHAFGAEVPLSFTEQPQERLKFTGHERDLSPDIHTLDYMHARYYSATLGRFLSVDPAPESVLPTMPQSWNRYSYVLNNPFNITDPTGLRPCRYKLTGTDAEIAGVPDGTVVDGECVEAEADKTIVEKAMVFEPIFVPAANAATGFADTLTFDATRKLREHMGDDQVVNPCSDWYTGGQIAGVVWWGAAGGAVGGRIGGNMAARELGNLTLTNSQYAARGLAGLSDAQKLAAMGGVRGGIIQALKNAVTPSWWGAILKTTATTTPTPAGWGGLVGVGVGGASAAASQANNDC